jgi:NADH-quinone oxidoreductase subunit M
MSQFGGMASQAPALTVFAVIMALANIALPLTNAFAGEMMMFGGLFQYSKWLAAVAGLSVILAALYTLNMLRNVFFGNMNASLSDATDISWRDRLTLAVIALVIFVTGVYPQFLIGISKDAVEVLLGVKS